LNILFLGPNCKYQKIAQEYLYSLGHKLFIEENDLVLSEIQKWDVSYLISYGYRKRIKNEVINFFCGRAINLHISYLPWNKGADPNLWSFLDKTPTGVTIHKLDKNIDTGDILCQRIVDISCHETLATSYNILNEEIVNLLKDNWHHLINNNIMPIKQNGQGSIHKAKDKFKYKSILSKGWDTRISDLLGKGL